MPSVFLKRNTWYLQVKDANGRRRCLASRAATKTDAKRLAFELERRYERQKLGLEPAAIADGLKTVADLLEWWIETFLKNQSSYENAVLTVRKHLVRPPLDGPTIPGGGRARTSGLPTGETAKVATAGPPHRPAPSSRHGG